MILGFAKYALAASMLAVGITTPPLAGAPTPTFRSVQYDGLGRKKKPKAHPRHNANRRLGSFAEFRRKVEATHSFNPDPRDDKYLHSHARQYRALRLGLAAKRPMTGFPRHPVSA